MFLRLFRPAVSGQKQLRLLSTTRCVLNEIKKAAKDDRLEAEKRLNEIIKDIKSDQPGEKSIEKRLEDIKNDTEKHDKSQDAFNIKQLVDTVREGENFKKLQDELSNFYSTTWQQPKDKTEPLSKRVDSNVKELKKSIQIASKVVNDVTGYSNVMKLRDEIGDIETKLNQMKEEIQKAKKRYQSAIELRSSSQKEINALLERKNTWDQVDLQRFTKLYMSNHDLETSVTSAEEELKQLETIEEESQGKLIKCIMNRYHEEQTWSDKIRQFSTWVTLLILCGNMLLVLLVQFVFEPFKRWRLVSSFEDKVKELFQNKIDLENDLMDMMISLKDLEERMLRQNPVSVFSGLASGVWDKLQGFETQSKGFLLTEPVIPEIAPHEASTPKDKIVLHTKRIGHHIHYLFIHQINVFLMFLNNMKNHVIVLGSAIYRDRQELQEIALTGIVCGFLMGLVL